VWIQMPILKKPHMSPQSASNSQQTKAISWSNGHSTDLAQLHNHRKPRVPGSSRRGDKLALAGLSSPLESPPRAAFLQIPWARTSRCLAFLQETEDLLGVVEGFILLPFLPSFTQINR
jgi:hypothetical protein